MTRAVSPRSLAAALAALAEDPGLVPVAGCTDLMVCEPLERVALPGVIDLLRVPELAGLRRVDGGLEIGATTTFREIGESPQVRRDYPALAAAAAVVGGRQIQNRATIGGNVANASPAGDSLPVLLALDAEVTIAGASGDRVVPYREFHSGYRKTALAPGELLVAVRLPAPAAGTRQLFRKVGTREAQAISKVVVALAARLEEGAIREPRLAAGSVAPIPVRFESVERFLAGRRPDVETADEAGRLAAASVEPIDDVRSTAAYRRFALERVVRRMVLTLAT